MSTTPDDAVSLWRPVRDWRRAGQWRETPE